MATTEAIPSINFPHLGQDDDMELSSDHGRYDGDFDIDIDQGGDYADEADVDQMQEDLKSDRGMTDLLDPLDGRMNDDEMAEGSIDGRYEPQDGMMQDEGTLTEIHDEDLGDFVGDESGYTQEQRTEVQDVQAVGTQEDTLYDEDTGDTTLRPEEQALDTGHNHLEPSHFEEVNDNDTVFMGEVQSEVPQPLNAEPQPSSQEMHSQASKDQEYEEGGQELEPTTANSAEPQNAENFTEVQAVADENPGHYHEQYEGGYEQQDQSINVAEPEHDEQADHEGQHNNELGDNDSQTVVGDNAQSMLKEHAGASTVTGLHPTIVRYEGSEVFLFPSADLKSQEEYFLQDENLVNGSIGDMLEACRVVLGGDISEDDELELTVEDLGLSLSEDSTPAFSASFSEILQLYVQLQGLDGVEQPAPMYVTLSTKTRFTNRLTLLTQAVRDGKGLSSIPLTKEMMYDEDETFTEYHEAEGDDLGDDVTETPSGHAAHQAEHADNPQLPDESTLARGDDQDEHEADVINAEHAHTVGDETAEPVEHNSEEYQNQEGEHAQEPVDNEESRLSATQLDADHDDKNQSEYLIDYSDDDDDLTPLSAPNVTNPTEDDGDTNTGKEDNETAHEGVTAGENSEHSHTTLHGQSDGDAQENSNAESTYYGADEINFDDEAEEVGAEGVMSPQKPNVGEEEKLEAGGQQEDVIDPPTTDPANDDLPPVPEDDLDEIDFDDDEVEDVAENNATSLKRPFTEHTGDLDLPNDEQLTKRTRS